MDIKRRNFLKIAAGGGLLLAGGVPAMARDPKQLSAEAVGMLYDATACIGCRACQSACKQHNEMPVEHSSPDSVWDDPVDLSSKTLNIIKVYATGSGVNKDSETDGYSFIKRHCMHCVDPACVSACPVSALKKDARTGVVSYDKGACIGCRYCQLACPYNIPKFEYDKAFPQIRKCQLCEHRFKDNKFSACCEFCPTGASIFGKVSDLLAEAKKRLTLKPGEYYSYPVAHVKSAQVSYRPVAKYLPRVYGEKEGGGSQVLMLAAVPFEKLGMPALDEQSDAAFSENIQHTVYKGMIGPGVLLAGLLFAAYKNTHKNDE